MTKEDLESFLDGYIVTMNLAGSDLKWEASETERTTVYYVIDKKNKTIIDFFYHKEKKYEGLIYIYEYTVYDRDEFEEIFDWLNVNGNATYTERIGRFEIAFTLKNVELLIEFFCKFMMNKETVV